MYDYLRLASAVEDELMAPAQRKDELPPELPEVFRWSQAREAGLSDRRLKRLVRDGIVERIGAGIYRMADAPPADVDMLEIAAVSNLATLCLASALARHDLIDLIPSRIDVALPRGTRPPRVMAPVRWHSFSPDTFDLGRTEVELDKSLRLGVYSSERSICDAYRMRHLEGEDLGREALRTWVKRKGSQPSKLLLFAESFPKARSAIRRDLELLL
ncbi:MAG: type IV toxin-antitoxin system AbiEi family antitoxin domain-containing protein [Actinomycetota bacterium]|nr:type IV toxin-antitoxin system AbiEi family antitoxin domain-containing protein [Actinomycetota bacterium]